MLYVHNCLCRMWLSVLYSFPFLFSHIFLNFSKLLDNFLKYFIFQFMKHFFVNPGRFSKLFTFSSKLQVIFHSFVPLDFEFPAFHFILPVIFKILVFFLSLISIFLSFSQMASSQLDSVFLKDHISYEVRQSLPEHRALSTGPFFPRWYYTWFKNFSCMFSDHLSDCGLELTSAVEKLTVNGNLIHALAERWNPRTCTFWFPWGEMTLLMDEFSEIIGLPEPAGQFGDPLEQQFLINVKGLDPKDVVARMTERKSWPLIEENGNEYVSLIEIYRQYGAFVEVSSLSRTTRERIQHAMVLCNVGLAFFLDEQNYVDARIVQLLRRWGSRQTRRLSIAMAALAFLYRGLTRFTLGESILVEGCTYTLQSWFLQHVPIRANSFR